MYIPYVLLLMYIVGAWIACSFGDNLVGHKRKKIFVVIAFIGVFFFSALRAYTVGYDYPAYYYVYNSIGGMTTNAVFSINFEVGYLAVMKICSDIGMSFYGFAAVVYIIILVPIAVYIYQQSEDPFLSIMVYICYMFFEFNLTGVRQSMSISMCLLGYLVMKKKPKLWIFWYYTLILIGILFHRGAFIATIVPFFTRVRDIRITSLISVFMIVVALVFRRVLLSFIKELFSKDSMNPDSGLYFGANFFFLFAFAILFVYFAFIRQKKATELVIQTKSKQVYEDSYSIETNIYLLSIVALLFFGMDNSGRAYMNLNIVMISLLPNTLSYIEPRTLIKGVMLVFLVVFFFLNSLVPNGFRIIPYRFFWSIT